LLVDFGAAMPHEVLSVPVVKKSANWVQKFHVHACPDSYKYEPTKYITFRQPNGGEMKALYPIGTIYIFSPKDPIPDKVAPEDIDTLKAYIQERFEKRHSDDVIVDTDPNQPYRFYMLPNEGVKELLHRPKPAKNNAGHRYYSEAELTSGKKEVSTDSKGPVTILEPPPQPGKSCIKARLVKLAFAAITAAVTAVIAWVVPKILAWL
jgi:hypothetical protein